MAEPVKKIVMTPKSVYFPQHEAKEAPTSHPAPPGSNLSSDQQQQLQDKAGA